MSAYGKSYAPGQVFLGILFTVDGTKKVTDKGWPGGEEWSKVTVSAKVPIDVDPKSIRIRILIRPDAKGKHLVDNLQAKLL